MQTVMMMKARYANALLPLLITLSMTTALTTMAPRDHGRAAQQEQEPTTTGAPLPATGREVGPVLKSRFSISRIVFFLTFALVMVVLMLIIAIILHVQRRRRETITTTMNQRGGDGAAAEGPSIYWHEYDRDDQTANYVNTKT
jgi:hypothetical protein